MYCSAPSSAAVDILSQAPGIAGVDGSLAWVELVVSDLHTPESKGGAQSCVKVALPTERRNYEAPFSLRVRLPGTVGESRYVCVYGLEALVYSNMLE